MNEVSIIINGVRYETYAGYCSGCDLRLYCGLNNTELCTELGLTNKRFKKNDKKFEK